jgi:hypothetical protein
MARGVVHGDPAAIDRLEKVLKCSRSQFDDSMIDGLRPLLDAQQAQLDSRREALDEFAAATARLREAFAADLGAGPPGRDVILPGTTPPPDSSSPVLDASAPKPSASVEPEEAGQGAPVAWGTSRGAAAGFSAALGRAGLHACGGGISRFSRARSHPAHICGFKGGCNPDGLTQYREGQNWRRKMSTELARRPEWIAEWRARRDLNRRIHELCERRNLVFRP